MQVSESTISRKITPKGSFFSLSRLPDWLTYLTYLLLFVTIAGRFGQYVYIFELFSHFSVQLIALGAGLSVYWGLRRHGLALVAVCCLGWHSYQLLPWLIAAKPTSATEKPTLRVLHANVLYTRDELETTAQMIREQHPDIFVLQEMTPESIEKISAAFQSSYPYQDTLLAKDPCFLFVASRTPMLLDRQAMRAHRVIHLMTTINDHDISFITVHPRTPILPGWFTERNEQLAFAAQKAREVPHPAVLIGDFNISVFSPVYATTFDKEPGLTACRKGFGLQATWPRFLPPVMIPIDHAFVNEGFQTINFQTLPQPGSDHKALVVDLRFK